MAIWSFFYSFIPLFCKNCWKTTKEIGIFPTAFLNLRSQVPNKSGRPAAQ